MKRFLEIVAASLLAVLLIAALFCLCLPAVPVGAATDPVLPSGSPSMTWSNRINGAVTVTGAGTQDMANAANLGVQVASYSDASNTSNTIVMAYSTVDGTHWTSNYSIRVTNTGTTSVDASTNWYFGGARKVRFAVANQALAGVTNDVAVTAEKKSGL